jgi:hypothetical protein
MTLEEVNDARRAVLLAIVDRALGPHAHAATITVEQYSRDIAHCSRSTGYEAVKRGDVASMRVAGRIVIPVPAIAVQLLGVLINNGGHATEAADGITATSVFTDPGGMDSDVCHSR